MILKTATIFLVLGCIMLAGCGKKGDPIAPANSTIEINNN